MRTINDVGKEILSGNPKGFYVFLGPEYGIKMRYIDSLKEHYGEYKEYEYVDDVLKIFNTRHLIPLKPILYIVRYDEEFVSKLSEKVKQTIDRTNCIGTLVCIYENEKQAQKLDKYIGNYCVNIDPVNPKFVEKYLHQEFSGVPDRLVKLATKISTDYGQARNICKSIKAANMSKLNNLTDAEISNLFGYDATSSESNLRRGIAARNFNYLCSEMSKIDDKSTIYYTILQTMIDLDRIKDNRYYQSDIKEYEKKWTRPDIYYMFNHTYEMLKKSRLLSFDIEDSLVYLFSLLAFQSIPPVGSI